MSAVGKRRWHSSAHLSPTKALNRDVAPIGDHIVPVGESRADVVLGNDEDEEPLDRVRMKPKNPTSKRSENMKIQDMLSTGVGVLLVSKAEVLVDNIELNCWKKRKENGRLRS